MASRSACFEIFGFDVLLDESLKAWLIEVNVSPSLSSSSPLDKRIKSMLMTDAFHLSGFTPYNPKKLDADVERERQERLLGKARVSGGTLHLTRVVCRPLLDDVRSCRSVASQREAAVIVGPGGLVPLGAVRVV